MKQPIASGSESLRSHGSTPPPRRPLSTLPPSTAPKADAAKPPPVPAVAVVDPKKQREEFQV